MGVAHPTAAVRMGLTLTLALTLALTHPMAAVRMGILNSRPQR